MEVGGRAPKDMMCVCRRVCVNGWMCVCSPLQVFSPFWQWAAGDDCHRPDRWRETHQDRDTLRDHTRTDARTQTHTHKKPFPMFFLSIRWLTLECLKTPPGKCHTARYNQFGEPLHSIKGEDSLTFKWCMYVLSVWLWAEAAAVCVAATLKRNTAKWWRIRALTCLYV